MPPASACTSSTMTVSTLRSASRACEVSSRNSDSGVVIRMSGGCRGQLAALVRRGVAGAHADPDVRCGQAQAVRGVADAGQRRAQVALDIHRERLERRDVEHPAALPRIGRGRLGGQLVDGPQERGQRLARPGRRDHQRVLAPADGRPGLRLRRRRLGEGGAEPGPGGLAEAVEHRAHRQTARACNHPALPCRQLGPDEGAGGRVSARPPDRSRPRDARATGQDDSTPAPTGTVTGSSSGSAVYWPAGSRRSRPGGGSR